MTPSIGPTAVSVTVPLAETPVDPLVVAESLRVERTHVGAGCVMFRAYHDDDDGVSWEGSADATPVGVRIDAGESRLTVGVETDGPEVPTAVSAVRDVVCDRFRCVPADDAPTYRFELGAPFERVTAALDRDRVITSTVSVGGDSSAVSYEYDGVRYQIREDDTVVLSTDVDDPAAAMATLVAHLNENDAS